MFTLRRSPCCCCQLARGPQCSGERARAVLAPRIATLRCAAPRTIRNACKREVATLQTGVRPFRCSQAACRCSRRRRSITIMYRLFTSPDRGRATHEHVAGPASMFGVPLKPAPARHHARSRTGIRVLSCCLAALGVVATLSLRWQAATGDRSSHPPGARLVRYLALLPAAGRRHPAAGRGEDLPAQRRRPGRWWNGNCSTGPVECQHAGLPESALVTDTYGGTMPGTAQGRRARVKYADLIEASGASAPASVFRACPRTVGARDRVLDIGCGHGGVPHGTLPVPPSTATGGVVSTCRLAMLAFGTVAQRGTWPAQRRFSCGPTPPETRVLGGVVRPVCQQVRVDDSSTIRWTAFNQHRPRAPARRAAGDCWSGYGKDRDHNEWSTAIRSALGAPVPAPPPTGPNPFLAGRSVVAERMSHRGRLRRFRDR